MFQLRTYDSSLLIARLSFYWKNLPIHSTRLIIIIIIIIISLYFERKKRYLVTGSCECSRKFTGKSEYERIGALLTVQIPVHDPQKLMGHEESLSLHTLLRYNVHEEAYIVLAFTEDSCTNFLVLIVTGEKPISLTQNHQRYPPSSISTQVSWQQSFALSGINFTTAVRSQGWTKPNKTCQAR